MNTIDRIRNLCANNSTSIKALEKELGFSNGSIAKAATIKADRLQKIAEHFHVSVEYLLTGEAPNINSYHLNEETAKTAQEIYEKDSILFDVYRSGDKDRLIEYAKKLQELRKLEERE